MCYMCYTGLSVDIGLSIIHSISILLFVPAIKPQVAFQYAQDLFILNVLRILQKSIEYSFRFATFYMVIYYPFESLPLIDSCKSDATSCGDQHSTRGRPNPT